MNIKNLITETEKALCNARISPDNLIKAIIKLLELAHTNKLDAAAINILSDCGITLEIEEV